MRMCAVFLVCLAMVAQSAPRSDDDDAGQRATIGVGGVLQARYTRERETGGDRGNDFSLRRAHLDLRGTLPALNASFRIQHELRDGNLRLRDIWLHFNAVDRLALRVGQFTVPFGLPRSIGGPRRLATELSIAGNALEVPQGRDVGMTARYSGAAGNWALTAGLFDGRGRLDLRDRERPSTSRSLYSARFIIALIGEPPSDNLTLGKPMVTTMALGAGMQHARRNHLRDWSLGVSTAKEPTDRRADWTSYTLDALLKHRRLMASAALFEREISPDHYARYVDRAWELELACAFPAANLELVLRRAALNRDMNGRLLGSASSGDRLAQYRQISGRRTEQTLGVNVYHNGNRHKTQLFWLDQDTRNDGWIVHVQHQFVF